LKSLRRRRRGNRRCRVPRLPPSGSRTAAAPAPAPIDCSGMLLDSDWRCSPQQQPRASAPLAAAALPRRGVSSTSFSMAATRTAVAGDHPGVSSALSWARRGHAASDARRGVLERRSPVCQSGSTFCSCVLSRFTTIFLCSLPMRYLPRPPVVSSWPEFLAMSFDILVPRL
jgi:hypothetical protein